MKKHLAEDVSSLLLELYRLSSEMPMTVFQDAALDLIKPYVPFSSSMWGTATTTAEGIDVRTLHLHQKSPDMMIEYEEHKHLDSAAAYFFGKGDRTRGFNVAQWFTAPKEAQLLDYLRRYEQNNILITTSSEPRTSFLQWVSLFRASPDSNYTTKDEQLVAVLSPHLMQAVGLNRVLHLDRTIAVPINGQSRGAAIADLHGAIYHCAPAFDELMREEFSGWASGQLPKRLLEHFMSAQPMYVGQNAVLTQRVEQRLLFIAARKRCRADNLSSRERTVAERLSLGETHKEIAAALGRSPNTVRNQIQSVYDKLEVNNVAGLIQELALAA